jgi:hypothetical protein
MLLAPRTVQNLPDCLGGCRRDFKQAQSNRRKVKAWEFQCRCGPEPHRRQQKKSSLR